MRTLLVCFCCVSGVAAAGERAHIVRKVPDLPASALADCSADSVAEIGHEISVAISLGAPTYNNGDFEGCYRTYANAALGIDAREKSCTGVRKALLNGVARADRLRTWDEKAWAMRDAFDGVLGLIERSAPAELAAAPERHIPRYPTRSLDDCAVADRARVKKAILEAIDVGAPLFNDGNTLACAKVYVGAAVELQAELPGCTRVKAALSAAVTATRGEADPSSKAWRMRDAFDGLLDVIARKAKANPDEI